VGTPAAEIASEFREFQLVNFKRNGAWDYVGESPRENNAECRARGERIKQWLLCDALNLLRKSDTTSGQVPTVLLCTHQRISDLLCHLFAEGSAERWTYPDIKYKMRNAALTELLIRSDGTGSVKSQNDDWHVVGLERPMTKAATI
jgi:hypothetical protein